MLKNKIILYLVHDYNNFQKDPIEETSKYFKKVYVLVRYKPISKIVKYLPFKSLKKFDDSYVVDLNDVPDNVEVIRVPVWYLPFGIFYKLAGYSHYSAVKKTIKKYNIQFDLIHSHFIWTSGYVGMRLKEKYGKPLVVTGHGYDVYDLPFKSDDWKRRIAEVLRRAERVFTVSKKNKEIIEDLGTDKSKIKIIYNSFNENLFYPVGKGKAKEDLGIGKKREIILSVGNLEEVKGHKYLIEAIRILIKESKYKNLKLYIIGGGSLYESLKSKIESFDLEKNIFLLGAEPHDKIPIWMNACDLFVLPSLSESFGIVQIEALACGKPVVASKNEGSKEIVTSEEYGLLCEIADPEDLAEKINNALEKKWDEKKIIDYSNMFKQENLVKEQIKEYEKLTIKD